MDVQVLEPRTSVSKARISSLDFLRGLVMVIMALDHVRDFWGPTPALPEDLSQTTVPLFLTRWITHLCAPTFIFLSGVSIHLFEIKQGRKSASIFSVTRGLWLIVVELLMMSFLLAHGSGLIVLSVLWAIGCSMILMSSLLWIPRYFQLLVSLLIIAGHNLLPPITPVSTFDFIVAIFHNPPFLIPGLATVVTYSIVPWVGVMLAGYALGPLFSAPERARDEEIKIIGASLILIFLVLRIINRYGDPVPYSFQSNGAIFTMLSFLNVTKYPPSLLFLCLTLGCALLIYPLMKNPASRVNRILAVYGQVPFFFFVLHFALISLSSYLWTDIAFGKGINLAFTPPEARPEGYEPNLLRVYGVWFMILIVTYYPCKWFGLYKKRNKARWLSYL